jgi:hypothetical protein
LPNEPIKTHLGAKSLNLQTRLSERTLQRNDPSSQQVEIEAVLPIYSENTKRIAEPKIKNGKTVADDSDATRNENTITQAPHFAICNHHLEPVQEG